MWIVKLTTCFLEVWKEEIMELDLIFKNTIDNLKRNLRNKTPGGSFLPLAGGRSTIGMLPITNHKEKFLLKIVREFFVTSRNQFRLKRCQPNLK